MKIDFKIKKESLIRRIIISLGIALSIILAEYFGVFQVIDNYIFDLAYMQDKVVDLPISIIAIDENTLENTEQGGLGDYKYWDRNLYAQLLETICREDSEPAMIVFDVVFSGPKTPDGDKRFADICIRLDFDESVVTEENGAKRLDTAKITTVGSLYPELEAINPIKGFTNNTMVFDKYVRTFIDNMNPKSKLDRIISKIFSIISFLLDHYMGYHHIANLILFEPSIYQLHSDQSYSLFQSKPRTI